ncbi:hypothetical protein RhiirC2_786703 [Rhizophagus irregularis]|uniref:Uncharacterized protein n=1 Tax=Rhizophagus irregularis TaxID=588596 RepID=A0A2N1MTU8_9GLOM|nr:hypothetical protein RhiirC2_786703 [Rhizophagus irregularis]
MKSSDGKRKEVTGDEEERFSSSAILTRGNKAVLSVFLDANLGDSLNSLWIWDSELPILFGNRSECPSLVEIEDLSIGHVGFR